jgi:hypothetical protein
MAMPAKATFQQQQQAMHNQQGENESPFNSRSGGAEAPVCFTTTA